MTSSSRPIDSPLRSEIGRLSSCDRRKVTLLSAGALGPAAPGGGVVVIGGLFLLVTSSPASLEFLPCRPPPPSHRRRNPPATGWPLPRRPRRLPPTPASP